MPVISPELIMMPDAAQACVRLLTSTSGSCGSTTGMMSMPNLVAKSKSLWSCAGTPMTAPVP